ncbi:MAG TPA: hypothetical protein DIT65_05600 [Cryomorphaceae bacterium]|nr:hypothetical protein [Cryomorphaceae bacterium]|tara:strand:- start:292 stop:480 length:189 start_codon:yes stop_codon:yes gene_type:complete
MSLAGGLSLAMTATGLQSEAVLEELKKGWLTGPFDEVAFIWLIKAAHRNRKPIGNIKYRALL